jgi:hypothetical protein
MLINKRRFTTLSWSTKPEGDETMNIKTEQAPAAQLAILPGFTHYNILSTPALPPVVTRFLDAPKPMPSQP